MLPVLPYLLALGPWPAAQDAPDASSGPGAWFDDHTASLLPGVETTCGGRAKDWIVEVQGGGLVLEDFDGDGVLDLVLVDGSTLERVNSERPGLPPRLFLGDGAGGFEPAGEAWGMAPGRWGMGGAAGDVDGDGDADLLVTEWGRDRLFLNEEGAGFREVGDDAGLVGERWGTSAAFLDYDGDGVLDLVVVNYLAFDTQRVAAKGAAGAEGCVWRGHPGMCGPEGLVPVHDQLYRGRGDGSFEEVSVEAGFRPRAAAFGLGLVTLDYDRDGDTDVYVANDSTPNHLWEIQGDGSFREVGFRRGVAHDANGREQAGMGIAVGDADGDGRADLFVTNFSGEANAFYASSGERSFRERAAPLGLGGPGLTRLGWGTGFGDLDLDGDLDLFVLNGHVYPEADAAGTDTSYAQPDQVFLNQGERFSVQPLSAGPARVSRAGALADLDRDGDLDLIALAVEGGVRVLLNPVRTRGQEGGPRGVSVRLVARGSNRAGLGATVRVEWEGGHAERELTSAGGFQAGLPAEVHFGLGSAERIERLTVRWPSGETQVLEDVALAEYIVVEEEQR